MTKYAYVTCLTNEKYLPGMFALKESLNRVKSEYDLYVLIPDNNEALESQVMKKVPGVFIISAKGIPDFPEMSDTKHYWKETFFKLRALSLTQFEKIILIDSDMMVLQNIDHLFKCESLSAVVSGEVCHPEYSQLNSGLVVIEPKQEMAEEYIQLIPTVYELRKAKGAFSGDQDVFHYLNKNWPDPKSLKLPEGYNEFLYCCGKFLKNAPNGIKDLYIVHFIGSKKPWEIKPLKLIGSYLRKLKFTEARLLIKYYKILRKY